MYRWINLGSQKQQMMQLGEFPCCGTEKETVEHLYQCNHHLMHASRAMAFKTMEHQLWATKRTHQVAKASMETIHTAILEE